MFACLFFIDTATTEIYSSIHTLSLHDALPICDPLHVNAAFFVQVQGHAAPTAAYVKHSLAGFQRQLGCDMRFLVELRLLQAVIGINEVGAAILTIPIKEEFVEPIRQIIVMRDIRLCAGALIDPVELADISAAALLQPSRPFQGPT